jgi:hypothetical protein
MEAHQSWKEVSGRLNVSYAALDPIAGLTPKQKRNAIDALGLRITIKYEEHPGQRRRTRWNELIVESQGEHSIQLQLVGLP